MTLFVLKLVRSIDVNEVQPMNKFSIFIRLSVFKFEISIYFNEEQYANIPCILMTLFVLK